MRKLGFRIPGTIEEGDAPNEASPAEANWDPVGRPVANLAFFEGIGSMAAVLRRALANVVAHLSWETDEVTVDFLATKFPGAIPMGDAGKATAEGIKEVLAGLNLPRETLILISGGPACVDHFRIKREKAAGGNGREGRKRLQFAKLIKELQKELPWESRFLVEHVVPWGTNTIRTIIKVLGVEAVLVDAADLKLMRKPRLWWSSSHVGANVEAELIGPALKQMRVKGIEPLEPKDVKVGSIEG